MSQEIKIEPGKQYTRAQQEQILQMARQAEPAPAPVASAASAVPVAVSKNVSPGQKVNFTPAIKHKY